MAWSAWYTSFILLQKCIFTDFSANYFNINIIHLSPAKGNTTADLRVGLLRYHWSHTHERHFSIFFLSFVFLLWQGLQSLSLLFILPTPIHTGKPCAHIQHVPPTTGAVCVCRGFPGPLQHMGIEGAPAAAEHPAAVGTTHLGILQNKRSQKRSLLSSVFFETIISNIHAKKAL